MKDKKNKQDAIETRLNAIIRLLSDSLEVKDSITKKSIYKSLSEVGLTPTEIGKIFGKSRTDISAVISRKEKSTNKRSKT